MAVTARPTAPAAASTVRLRAVGDIMLAGPMGQLMARRGSRYPFAAMRPVLRQADIVFGNLECSVSDRGRPIPKQFNFRADPGRLSVLPYAGFTIVSLANNHAWDYGRDALLDTVDNVRRIGVIPVGAGADRAAAHALRVLNVKGLRVGFLAYLGLHPPLLPESDTRPCLAMASVATIRREVRAARPQVDVLIMSMHDGVENAPTPDSHQRELAHTAIDAGADLVIGCHPHVVQPMERYRNRWICYSLGNFVFSTSGRGSGGMLDAVLSRSGCLSARLIRLRLVGAQPRMPIAPRHRSSKLYR